MWFTDKTGDDVSGYTYGNITVERVYTEAEERDMALARAKALKATQDKLAAAMKASLKSAAKEAAEATARRQHLHANAHSLLRERGWRGRMQGTFSHELPSSNLLAPQALRLSHAPPAVPATPDKLYRYINSLEYSLPKPLATALERLPSPMREQRREYLLSLHAQDMASLDRYTYINPHAEPTRT